MVTPGQLYRHGQSAAHCPGESEQKGPLLKLPNEGGLSGFFHAHYE